MIQYVFNGKLWASNRPGGWHLVTIPANISKEILVLHNEMDPGKKSLPSTITVGKTRWTTSIFFDNGLNVYLVPLKGEVRKKEKLSIGDIVEIKIDLIF